MESLADDILGPVSGSEYDLLQSKLGGTRGNRVFSFFEIEAPQRSAENQIANQKATAVAVGAGGSTAVLKKKKRKRGGPGPSGAKRSKLVKRSKLLEFLTSSPLRSAGESEDDGGKGSLVAAASPTIAAQPVTVAAPPPKAPPALEYSAMEPDGDDELAIDIQSAFAATEPHVMTSAAAPSSPKSTSTSSDSSSSSSGEDVEGHGPGLQKLASVPNVGTTGAVGEDGQLPPTGSSVRRLQCPLRRRAAAIT